MVVMPLASHIFITVFDGHRHTRAFVVNVRVQVDQPWQDVFARRVDLDIASRRTIRLSRHCRDRIETRNLRDNVVFDNDVKRPGRRFSTAVNDHRIADDDPLDALAGNSRRIDLSEYR